MKQKLLAISVFLIISGNIFSQAVLRVAPINTPVVTQTEAQTAANTLELRYCSDVISRSLGVSAGAEIDAAIFIPKSIAGKYAGKNLTKIKVGSGKDAATNTRIFIRTSLSSDPVYTQAATFNPSSWSEIVLTTPYVIPANTDLYIGYSLTSGTGSSYYPLGIDNSPKADPNGDIIRYKVGSTQYDWDHIGSQGFTNFNIIGIVEGEGLPEHDILFQSLVLPISAVGKNDVLGISGNLKNVATEPVTNLEVSYKIGTSERVTKSLTGLNIPSGGSYDFQISGITFNWVDDEYPIEVSFDKINGYVDEYPVDNSQSGLIRTWNAPSAPTIVSRQPSKKNVVLEEFTGINCQYCPDGHKRANQIAKDNPNRVSVINIHQGGYANVIPDFRTDWGDAIAGQTGLDGYPAGTVNRHVFSGQYTTLGRGDFAARSNTILGQNSYVNVAIDANVDPVSRVLTVNVELYYTANGSPANFLNVAIIQDSIMGPQVGGSTYYPEMWRNNQYQHNHMLKDLITKQWGDQINQTTAGTFVAKHYVYTIPAAYRNVPVNLSKLEFIAFVAEGTQEIISGFSSKFPKIVDTISGLSKIEKTEYSASIQDGSLVIHSDVPVQNVTIYSVSGQKVLSSTVVSNAVSVKNLAQGVYVVKLQTVEGEKIVKVIR